MALAATVEVAAWAHEADGVVFASLAEREVLWWCRDGGLEEASAVVRVALEPDGRCACATADGTIYALAPHLRGATREWRCVARTSELTANPATWLAFDVARDGRVLVATANKLEVLAPTLAKDEPVEDHGLALGAAALAPSGRCLAAASENRLVAWHREEGWQPVALHHDCNRGYDTLAWTSTHRELLLAGCADGAVRMLVLARKGRDGLLALEPWASVREPGPGLLAATWVLSNDAAARVCVAFETDGRLEAEIRCIDAGVESDDAFAARVRPGDEPAVEAAFALAMPSSGVATVVALDAHRVVIVARDAAASVYYDHDAPQPLRGLLETPYMVVAHPHRNELAVLAGARCHTQTWATSRGGWARADNPSRLQSEDEAATRFAGIMPRTTAAVDVGGVALGACWRGDNLLVALASGAIVEIGDATTTLVAPTVSIDAVYALIAYDASDGDFVLARAARRGSDAQLAAWRVSGGAAVAVAETSLDATCAATHAWLAPASTAAFVVGGGRGLHIAELRGDRWAVEAAAGCKAPALLCTTALGARVACVDEANEITLYQRADASDMFRLERVGTIEAAPSRVVAIQFPEAASSQALCAQASVPAPWRLDAVPAHVATSDCNGVVRVYTRETGEAWTLWRRLEPVCGVAGRAFAGVADLIAVERPRSRRRALARACAVCAGVEEADASSDEEDTDLAALVAAAAHGTGPVDVASRARGESDAPLFGVAAVALLLASLDERDRRAQAVDVAARIQKGAAADAGGVALRALRRDRLSWWASTQTLRAAVEAAAAACARLAGRGGRNVPGSAASAAVLYVACGRVATLKTLARSDSSRGGLCGEWGRKLGKLLEFDFTTDRGQTAGRKNAYALLAKHEPALACAAFLLAGDVEDACSVALAKLHDPDLALAIARLADDTAGLVCGLLARKVLRSVAKAHDCDRATAALACLWLGRPRRAARHLAARVAAAATPVDAASPLEAFEAAFDAATCPALVRRLVGNAGARRVVLDAATAALARGAPAAALAALAAAAADAGPFTAPVRRAGADVAASPPPPPPVSSIFDDFDAAPQRKAPPLPPQAASSIFDGFDAAPQAPKSMLDGFDAAPQRQAPPSMLDGFDAAPQRQAPPSMLDGFDAAPQRQAPPSMLDGFDAAPQRRLPPAATPAPPPAPEPTEAESSGDDEPPEATPPARERAREAALVAAARRLAAGARAGARHVGGDAAARVATLKREVADVHATHGLAPAVIGAAALAGLAARPGARPTTAACLIHAATAPDARGAARRVLTNAATDALGLATLPSAGAPTPRERPRAAETADDLRTAVALSETMESFADAPLARLAAAGARCASTWAPPERRRRVYRALLEHPPVQHGGEDVAGAAGPALELAKRFGDRRGWDRLRAFDRRGAEAALRHQPPGAFLLRPQQGSSGDAGVAISFVVGGDQVQHAIIRVAAAEEALEYRSGRLGPAPSLWRVLEEISERLGGAGLDLTEATAAWPSEVLDRHLPPDVGGDLDDLGGHWSAGPACAQGVYWSAHERRRQIVDLLACVQLQRQLGDLGASSRALERRARALERRVLRQLTPPLHELQQGASDGRRHRSPAPLRRRGSPTPLTPPQSPKKIQLDAKDGHVLAQLLHPRSGVSLRAPRSATGFLTTVNAVVSACFAPDEAAQWLAQHAHAPDEAAAAAKLERWRALRILVDAPSDGAPQLRYVDSWECEPVPDDEDELCLEGVVPIGRSWYARPRASGDEGLTALLEVNEWVSSSIRKAPVHVEALDDLTTPWPPQPTFLEIDSPFKRHLRCFLHRNAWFRRHGLKRRFSASIRVDLEALETLAAQLDGADAQLEAMKANAPPVNDAFAVLRLRHARPKGAPAPPPLSEKLRTRDACIAKRRGKARIGGGATWGAAAAFRFALPDEALPPSTVRLPTRGPPTVAYVCVYRREKHALAALGMPAQDIYLGDVEVPLDNLTEDQPLVQWLPLNGGKGQHWFLRVRVTLAFVLCELADPPAGATAMPTPDDRPRLVSSFSDFGD